MFVETFEKQCSSGPYSLKYHLIDHVVEDMQRLVTLPVLDSKQY